MSRRTSETFTIAVVAAIVFAIDQVTKHQILASFQIGESRMVIAHLLKLTFEQNTHGAFGLFGGNTALLIALAVAVLVVFWLSFRDSAHKSLVVRIAFGMIVGGAIGNIIDRLRYGHVVDFVHVSWFPGIFNMADSAITVGVLMLAGYLLLMGESGAGTTRQRPGDEALLGELLGQDQWRGDRR